MPQGFQTRVSLNGTAVEFISVKDLTVQEIVDNQPAAIRGVLDHQSERVALGRLQIGFEILMNVGPSEFQLLLPLMGFTDSAGSYTIGDTYTTFTAVIDRNTKVHHYTSAVIGKVVLVGQKGTDPVKASIQVLGAGFSEDTSYGSPTAMNTSPIYAFNGGATMSLRGGSKNFNQFQLTLDPHMEVQWNNSTTPTAIAPTNRDIILQTSTPYTSSESALFTTPLSSVAGAAGSLTLTNGANSTVFTFGNLKEIARPPSIPNKAQLRLPVTMRAYKTSSSAALAITNTDS